MKPMRSLLEIQWKADGSSMAATRMAIRELISVLVRASRRVKEKPRTPSMISCWRMGRKEAKR